MLCDVLVAVRVSFTLYLSGLYGFEGSGRWGFSTMLVARGRRPPSMSKGGMWPECGSDCSDGGRESRTREHSREGRQEGVSTKGNTSFS